MKVDTSTRVFLVAAIPVLCAELMRWTGGAYDSKPAEKIAGLFVLAILNAVLNGLVSTAALNTQPIRSGDILPRRPDQPKEP
jgi:hypothetical protein